MEKQLDFDASVDVKAFSEKLYAFKTLDCNKVFSTNGTLKEKRLGNCLLSLVILFKNFTVNNYNSYIDRIEGNSQLCLEITTVVYSKHL